MKKQTSLISFLFLFLFGTSQQYSTYVSDDSDAVCQTIYEVTARSGVKMRSEPNIRSELIAKIPPSSLVSVCEECSDRTETIDGIKSSWFKVCYKNKCGYVFGGYLKPGASYDLVFPGQKISQDEAKQEYVAVIKDEFAGFYTRLQPLGDLVSNGVCNAAKMKESNVLFLVDGIKSRGRLGEVFLGSETLLPGDALPVASGGKFLYATGSSKVKNGELVLEDYKLFSFNGVTSMLLYDHTFTNDDFHISSPVEVLWVGDIDGDRATDIIVKDGKRNISTLLLSSVAEKGHAVRQVSQTTGAL